MASTSGLPSLTFSSRGFKGLKGSSNNTGGFNQTSASNYGFSGGTNKNFGFKAFRYKAPRAPKGPTTQQVLERLYLQKQAHPHRGLLGTILHDATHTVEKGLDYLSRPSYAISSGIYDATKGKGFNLGQFAHGLKTGIEGKTKIGMGQVLQEHGILKGHGILRGLAGFGLDVTTDPVLLASLGTGAGEAEIAAREAEMGVAKGTLAKAVKAAATGSFKGAADAKNTAEVLRQAGAGFEARSALANAHANIFSQIEKGNIDKAFGRTLQRNLNGLQAVAHIEEAGAGTRMLRAQYKIPFGPMLSKELPVKAPNLTRVADAQGLLGKLPGLPKAAETIGKAFKPGWRNEKMHALEIMQKHIHEIQQEQMLHVVKSGVADMVMHSGISQKDMLDALHWGETHPGIVATRAGHSARTLKVSVLNQGIKAGELTPQQGEFLKGWHNTTEALRKADAEFGVKYDKQLLNGAKDNIIYVPHVRELQTGLKPGYQGSVLAKKGFQYGRSGESQIALLQKLAETNPDVPLATDPLQMISRRAMSGAAKQAEQFTTNTVASTFGHPKMIPDIARQMQLQDTRRKLMEKLNSLKTLDPGDTAELHKNALAETEAAYHRSLLRAGIGHMAKAATMRKELISLKGQLTKATKRQIPTAHQFIHLSDEKVAPYLKAWSKGTTAKQISKSIKVGRSVRKSLDALERQVSGSVKKAGELAPITGTAPHGSNYKALVADLLDKAGGILPKSAVDSMRESHQLRKFKRGESWEQRHQALVEDLLGTIKHARQANTEKLDAVLQKHLPNATKRTRLASAITLKQRALDNHIASFAQTEAKLQARHAIRLQNAMNAIEARREVELRIGNQARASINKIDRKIAKAYKRNPDVPHDFVEVPAIKHPNGSSIMLPPEMADALKRVKGSVNNDEFLQQFANTFQKLIAKWKVGVTVVNPGYRVRNTLSDLWNAYISPEGGVPVWAMAKYGGIAAKLVTTVAKLPEDPSTWSVAQRNAARAYLEMYHHGVLAGLFQGDVEKVRRTLEGRGGAKDFFKEGHVLKALTTASTNMNRHAENWGRMMHYLYRRDFQKMGAGQAAHIVRSAHFDYEDLTPTEQKIKKWAVPFYTWTRKNIPYQVSAAAMRPGKYAAFPLLANEMNAASPQDPGQIVPSWIKQSLGFHVPFGGKGNFYLPVFGPVDLEKVQHPLSQGLSMLSPLIQTPIELATNKSLNTGAPIYGNELTHPRTPISGFAADVLKNFPGTDVGTTARNVNGKTVRGPGANPLVSYFAQQTPLSNFLVNAESPIKKAQRGGGQKAALSEFGGIATYKPDQQAQIAAAQFSAQQGEKQYLKGLRDMGILPEPKKTKQSAATRKNNKLARQAFGGS